MARAYYGINEVSNKKRKIYEIIFEADTKEGKRFDVLLLWLVVFYASAIQPLRNRAVENKYRIWIRLMLTKFSGTRFPLAISRME